MVGTMAMQLPFIRPSRMTRTASHPVSGPRADDEVLLDAPDARLSPALVAAARGDHGPASGLLRATRAAAEWERRDRYVTRLAAFARSRPDWLDAWLAIAPHDPDALLLRAQLAVDRAWQSPARAEMLREVSPLITAAARADHADPVPWRLALDHARGARAGTQLLRATVGGGRPPRPAPLRLPRVGPALSGRVLARFAPGVLRLRRPGRTGRARRLARPGAPAAGGLRLPHRRLRARNNFV